MCPRRGDRVAAGVLTIAGLTCDGWGLANGCAILILGLIRWLIVRQYRTALDTATQIPRPENAAVKAIWILPSGKAVTIYAPRNIIVDCILTNPTPYNGLALKVIKALGWISFGVHIIALGMANLVD
jgi:hypothetical protein